MTANTFARSGKPFLNSYTTSTSLDSDLFDILIPREIFSEGGLWNSGQNTSGQLGDNTIVRKSSPVQTVAGGTAWIFTDNQSGIKADGTLWLWGEGLNGMLGNNSTLNRSSPVQTVSGGTNWKQVTKGLVHTGAIKTDGTLWMWGFNSQGQLGTNNITHRSSPTQTVAGGGAWKQVSVYYLHTVAVKTDGTLWTMGLNNHGQLGDNTIVQKSSPVQTISAGTNWKQATAGYMHTAAIKTDGTLWLWGYNNLGQLGNNTVTKRSSPTQVIGGGSNWKQVSSGAWHVSAVKTDGSLWSWGEGFAGGLGNNSTANRSSPVQTVSGGTNWKKVSCGSWITAAIKTDGTLWVWGWNSNGELGLNNITHRSSPVQRTIGGTYWKQASAGMFCTTAIKDDSIF